MSEWLKDTFHALTGTGEGKESTTEGSGAGEVSSGPNSFEDAETSVGGADSVAGTPDATPSVDLGDEGGERAPSAS